MALVQLGAQVISSIDEPSTNATTCRVMWDISRIALLREHAWNFATERVKLLPLVAPPVYRFKYAYQLPPDNLRTLTVYADNNRVMEEYKIEQRTLLSDADDCYFKYIQDKKVVSDWTADFQEVMAAKMRAAIAYSITGSSTQNELSESLFLQKFQRAVQVDSTEDTEDLIGENNVDLLLVRYE